MNYKIEKALKKSKTTLIVFLVLWTVLEILLIAPWAVSISNSTVNGKFNISKFLTEFGTEVSSFNSFTRISQSGAGEIFGKWTLILTIVLLICLKMNLNM